MEYLLHILVITGIYVILTLSLNLVVGYTGWSKFWNNPDKYRNADELNQLHIPGFSTQAAELLLKRNVVGIGIDTLSPDGGNTTFPVHHLMLKAGKYLIENLTNLEYMPATGAWVITLPLKIDGGTESPIRALGLVPNKD